MNKNNIKFLIDYAIISTAIGLPIIIAILAFLSIINYITGGMLNELY